MGLTHNITETSQVHKETPHVVNEEVTKVIQTNEDRRAAMHLNYQKTLNLRKISGFMSPGSWVENIDAKASS